MRYLVSLLVLIASFSTAMAQSDSTAVETLPQIEVVDNNTLWESGNQAYIDGDYALSVANYQAIEARGYSSARLFYNLGNAYYKQEKLGKAILNYNRALRLAPGDEDIRHNLEYATEATKDNIEEIPEFFLISWVRSVRNLMGCDGWTATSLILLIIALTGALAYLLAEAISLRKAGFYTLCITALLCIIATSFAYNKRQALVNSNEAVIMSTAAPIKSSPDRAATDLFVLHEGTMLTIEESTDGWVEIRIADGRKGWIESSRIELI